MRRLSSFSVALCLSLMVPAYAGAAVVSITEVEVKPEDATITREKGKDVVRFKKTAVKDGSSTLAKDDELKFDLLLKDFKLKVSDSGPAGKESFHITVFGSNVTRYLYTVLFTGVDPAGAAVPNPVIVNDGDPAVANGVEKVFSNEFVVKEFSFTDLHLTIKNLSPNNSTITHVTIGVDADTIVAPVPLPFGGVLMASALGALGLLRGRRRRQVRSATGWRTAVSV